MLLFAWASTLANHSPTFDLHSFEEFMTILCFCTLDCEDKHESCEAWAFSQSRDYCTTSEYVKKNCKTACGLCTTPLQKESGNRDKGKKDKRSSIFIALTHQGWLVFLSPTLHSYAMQGKFVSNAREDGAFLP